MNIDGLDYNTQREQLVMPEYGREVQDMVNHAKSLGNKADRQRCAENIVRIMERMFPQNRESNDYVRKLWDHLAIMSGFELDIDWPYDVSGAMKMASKPEPMEYPMSRIPVRHYGKMLFAMFDKLKQMSPGMERDELARVTANQMKRNLHQWGHGSNEDEKVVADMARYTDGVIQLDLSVFKFDRIAEREPVERRRKRR